MTTRDALFTGTITALAVASAIGMAAVGELPYGGNEVRAEAIGFDMLAHRMFGDKTCDAGADSAMPATESVQ